MYDYILMDLSIYKCKGFKDEEVTVGAYIDGGSLHNININRPQWTIPLQRMLSFFKEHKESKLIVVFDSYQQYFKSQRDPSYKSQRPIKTNINTKEEYTVLFLRLLEECNISYMYGPGLEADDCFYTFIKQTPVTKKILIVSNDSDILVNVADNVDVLREIKSDLKYTVTRSNFEDTIINRAKHKFNAIMASKIAYGDTSDSINPLPDNVIAQFYNVLNMIRIRTSFGHESWSNPEFLDSVIDYIEEHYLISDRELKLLKHNAYMVKPILGNLGDIFHEPDSAVNITELKSYYNLIAPRSYPSIKAKQLDNKVFRL